jgi:23S rRNA (adenine2503-C2)-methyltransferase
MTPPMLQNGQQDGLGSSRDAFGAFAESRGFPAWRGHEAFSHVFARRVQDFAAMQQAPRVLRHAFADAFVLTRPAIDTVQVSTDGTRKYRFVGHDGSAFEAVYIPEVSQGRRTNTLCISSQTGCAVGCKFCFTASLRRNRDLSPGEIVGQVLQVADDIAPLGDAFMLTNVVYMGMGEPLLNYDNVVQSARILMDPNGAAFSSRRVTISTSGIVPRIYDLGRDLPVTLAISLNASNDETRTRVMPINKKYPIAMLMQALRDYPLPRRRRFTIEYVLLAGINDSPQHAEELAALVHGLPVKINLLPLNEHDRTSFRRPTDEAVRVFQDTLWGLGYKALRRTPRGRDISAACGQLGETI